MGKDYQTETQTIAVSLWELGDWIIDVNGKPVGMTFSTKREAETVAEWLRTAVWEIREAIDVEKAKALTR